MDHEIINDSQWLYIKFNVRFNTREETEN